MSKITEFESKEILIKWILIKYPINNPLKFITELDYQWEQLIWYAAKLNIPIKTYSKLFYNDLLKNDNILNHLKSSFYKYYHIFSFHYITIHQKKEFLYQLKFLLEFKIDIKTPINDKFATIKPNKSIYYKILNKINDIELLTEIKNLFSKYNI